MKILTSFIILSLTILSLHGETADFNAMNVSDNLKIIDYPINSEKRQLLMKQYAKMHYGMNSSKLVDPKMIVIHYTGLPTLELSLKAFSGDEIPDFRQRLKLHGDVNVGVHFLVDYDGTIYSLLPMTEMGRHTIGYNYTSIAIENVGNDGSDIEDAQLEANVALISYILKEKPSIMYLIGHMEYMNQTYPHFKLFKQEDKEYKTSIKLDPGFSFMKTLRSRLKVRHNIQLLK